MGQQLLLNVNISLKTNSSVITYSYSCHALITNPTKNARKWLLIFPYYYESAPITKDSGYHMGRVQLYPTQMLPTPASSGCPPLAKQNRKKFATTISTSENYARLESK